MSSIVSQASTTTIPIVVDDIASANAMETMAVQLTSNASHSTLTSGSCTPRTSIIATSNQTFSDSDRFATVSLFTK